jgi:hypothetical protein
MLGVGRGWGDEREPIAVQIFGWLDAEQMVLEFAALQGAVLPALGSSWSPSGRRDFS